tara:strand:+ start:419 stop:853 length:435 start_codon:yes stop_codon:yes gene_type:complete
MEVNSFSAHSSDCANDSSIGTSFGISNVYTPSECTVPCVDEIDEQFSHLSNVIINNEINEYTIPSNLNQLDITAQLIDEIAALTAIKSETNSVSSGALGFSSRSESSYLSTCVHDVREKYRETLTSIELFDNILSDYTSNNEQI